MVSSGLLEFRCYIDLLTLSREDNYDFAGKRVGIIGNGSSAIQIVPKLQKVAGHLVNFMRTPTWISATFSSEFLPDGKNFYCKTRLTAVHQNFSLIFR